MRSHSPGTQRSCRGVLEQQQHKSARQVHCQRPVPLTTLLSDGRGPFDRRCPGVDLEPTCCPGSLLSVSEPARDAAADVESCSAAWPPASFDGVRQERYLRGALLSQDSDPDVIQGLNAAACSWLCPSLLSRGCAWRCSLALPSCSPALDRRRHLARQLLAQAAHCQQMGLLDGRAVAAEAALVSQEGQLVGGPAQA